MKRKKTITERMLILWQDPVAAEVHAEAAASVAEVSADHEAAEALEVALLAVLTVAVLEVHTMAVHLADRTVVILAVIITITVHSSGVPDVARYFMVVAVVSV